MNTLHFLEKAEVLENLLRLKVTWKCPKGQHDCPYTQEILEDIFEKYGNVSCFVSQKKHGRAILEFSDEEVAELAFEKETGYPDSPFVLSWLQKPSSSNGSETANAGASQSSNPATEISDDYENEVLKKLRQAEERKNLIKQIVEEG